MKGTPPAAVIYHAMPRRVASRFAYIHRHDDTWRLQRSGAQTREAFRLVLIDVIDIGIRRRADYFAVNNSVHQPLRFHAAGWETSALCISARK